MNFTLQFIADHQRMDTLSRILAGLRPGGILLLAEKICFAEAEKQNLMTHLHHSFKKAKGYSDLEISHKSAALEKVLIPNTEAQHRQRLLQAGFSRVERCMQCLNFAAFLAIK
jgi:tRNA (cmo5U34)-methyltransferase